MGRHYTQLRIADQCELARLYAQGCSLRQIAGRLRREAGHTGIAPETSYRFSAAQTTRTKPDRAWRHCPPRKTARVTVSPEWFTELRQLYNTTPRQGLAYQTPAEVF